MKWPKFEAFDLKQRSILLGYVGSIAHGTHIDPKVGGIDDKDVMGVCIPPQEYYLGLHSFEHYTGWVEEYDITIYELKKYVNLLLKQNPNVLGTLWLSKNHYIQVQPGGQALIDNRDMFSSLLAYDSFTGYAYGQFKRMTNFKFEGYMGQKRKELVEKFGYDTKNAAHLIRILRMGIEFIATGILNVQREDATQLIDIKKGNYTLERIKEMADDLFADARQALIKSPLPPRPDKDKVEKLLIDILEGAMYESSDPVSRS